MAAGISVTPPTRTGTATITVNGASVTLLRPGETAVYTAASYIGNPDPTDAVLVEFRRDNVEFGATPTGVPNQFQFTVPVSAELGEVEISERAVVANVGATPVLTTTIPVVPAVAQVITPGLPAPSLGTLVPGDTVGSAVNMGTFTAPQGFTISQTVVVTLNPGGAGTLLSEPAAGTLVTVEITTTAPGSDAPPIVTTLYTQVLYLLSWVDNGDNTFEADIPAGIPSSRAIPWMIDSAPWSSRMPVPVYASQDDLLAGPVCLVLPQVLGPTDPGASPTFNDGFWIYNLADPEPTRLYTLRAGVSTQ